MQFTLGTAARQVGRSKPTLSRAIKAGRLSASRQPDGSYLIDGAELFRVYPPKGDATGNDDALDNGGTIPVSDRFTVPEREGLLETIRDLRERLDAADTDRRQLTDKLAALMLPAPRRGWAFWRR